MVNKKGFLRVVEATISVMVVLSVLVFLSVQSKTVENGNIAKNLPQILEEIAKNLSIREKIARGENIENEIKTSIEQKIDNPSLNLSVRICDFREICFIEPYPDIGGDIYSFERIVSGSIKNETINPKKIKLFVWRN